MTDHLSQITNGLRYVGRYKSWAKEVGKLSMFRAFGRTTCHRSPILDNGIGFAERLCKAQARKTLQRHKNGLESRSTGYVAARQKRISSKAGVRARRLYSF